MSVLRLRDLMSGKILFFTNPIPLQSRESSVNVVTKVRTIRQAFDSLLFLARSIAALRPTQLPVR
jgi:hypothetical protein